MVPGTPYPRGTRGIRTGYNVKCPVCSKVFYTQLSKARKFCSTKCCSIYRDKKVVKLCSTCGNKISRSASNFDNKNGLNDIYFCSSKCYFDHRASRPTKSTFRSRSVKGRTKILYSNSCYLCGWSRHVEYAHIVPARLNGTIKLDNIVTLCPNHHTLFDRNKLTNDEQINLFPVIEKALDLYARSL